MVIGYPFPGLHSPERMTAGYIGFGVLSIQAASKPPTCGQTNLIASRLESPDESDSHPPACQLRVDPRSGGMTMKYRPLNVA